MSEPASGYAYRPEEPQCYNCGAKGHWAVACPEPTRATPAGLAAWKSSSSASHGNHRNQHGGSRRGNKGPIITKYAHPPPPMGHGLSQYPPPPPPPPPPLQSLPFLPPPPPPTPPTPTQLPGHHQALGQPYPGPTPAYQPHPPPYLHYPPPSPYPPSYHQPGYLPPHPLPHAPQHPPPHYAPPPVHYGVPHVGPSGYPTHPPGPPGPQVPVPYPPAYSPYPPARPPDPMSYGQPPTYYPPAYPPLPAYGSQPAPYPSPVSSGPGPGPASISPPIVQVHKPPAASQPPSQSIHHSLPPKPPRSRHLNPEPQREQRHKRRYDRQNRNRDNRQKEQTYAKRQGGKKQPPAQAKPTVSPTDKSVKSPATGMHEKENVAGQKTPEKSPPPQKDESLNGDGGREAQAEDEPEPRDTEEREVEADSDKDWEWDLKFIFREPEAAHDPDEVGVPLPEMYSEDALSPRPFTMVCIESKFVTLENVEEFTKPIREQAHWDVIKFDPAFIKDGRLAGEPLPTQKPCGKTPDPPTKTTEGHVEEDRAARGRKRKEGWVERADQERRHHKKSKMEEGAEQKLPDPTTSPSRSRQRRRQSHGSKGSRNSSVTSRSSDLNSLEAELLGRPTKRSPSDEDARHRTPSKPKRRRRPADSAYGRRW